MVMKKTLILLGLASIPIIFFIFFSVQILYHHSTPYVNSLKDRNYCINVSRINYKYDDRYTEYVEIFPGYEVKTGEEASSIDTVNMIEARSGSQFFRHILNSQFYEVQNGDHLSIVNFKENEVTDSLEVNNLDSYTKCFPTEYNYENLQYSSKGTEIIEWPLSVTKSYKYEEYIGNTQDSDPYYIRFYYEDNNLTFYRVISPDVNITTLFLVHNWRLTLPDTLDLFMQD